VALALAACAGPGHPWPASAPAAGSPLYVVSNNWHTGLAVEAAQLPPDRWPQRRAFDGYRYLEVGWGDRDAYVADRITARLALRAAFRSRGSALFVAAFDEPVARRFRGLDVVELRVDHAGLEGLAAFLEATYGLDAAGEPIALRAGWSPPGAFYLAQGRFGLLRTCNTWTAEALRAAGVPVLVPLTLTAHHLMAQVHALGRRLRPPG
jgi:uncharacterized protein (TIGR02117 family)